MLCRIIFVQEVFNLDVSGAFVEIENSFVLFCDFVALSFCAVGMLAYYHSVNFVFVKQAASGGYIWLCFFSVIYNVMVYFIRLCVCV